MADHVTKTGIHFDAFQWTGGIMSNTTTVFPQWTKALALHTPGDGNLHVPTINGTDTAKPTNWVMQCADGSIEILTNAMFTTYFT